MRSSRGHSTRYIRFAEGHCIGHEHDFDLQIHVRRWHFWARPCPRSQTKRGRPRDQNTHNNFDPSIHSLSISPGSFPTNTYYRHENFRRYSSERSPSGHPPSHCITGTGAQKGQIVLCLQRAAILPVDIVIMGTFILPLIHVMRIK